MQVADLYGKSRNLPTDPVAFVDPGVSGTGVALWEDISALGPPDETDRWSPRKVPWDVNFAQCVLWFEKWLGESPAQLVVIEGVEVWMGEKSLTAGARGNLSKLAYLVGALVHVCIVENVEWIIVTPSQWKAQLPKDAMQRRVRQALGVSYREHEYDAVAMGLAAQGRL